MSTTEMNSKFEAFDKYDFDHDEQFQVRDNRPWCAGFNLDWIYFYFMKKSGIASLLNDKQENEAELLERAKLFYYTK